MSNPTNPNDGKHVVIENGQRVTVPMEKEQAEAEAKRRNALTEGSVLRKNEANRAQVKQNLMG
jgi:hypothetical protein